MTWERALEADARLAAKNSVLIRAALRQSVDFEAAYRGYQATTPDESLTLPQQRTRARAWAIINIRVNLEAFKEVLYRTWAQAYALGNLAASEEVRLAREAQKDVQVGVDWSKWKPGDAASAIILKPPKAFQRLLERQGIVFKGFSDTTLTDLGNAIGEAIELGLDAKTAAKRIANHVASPARSLTIAITEQNRAISQATKERYLNAGLQKMTWLVFDPCDKCAQNAGKTVNINQPFPSGDTQPPAHPNCRCALAPVIPGYNDDTTSVINGEPVVSPSVSGITEEVIAPSVPTSPSAIIEEAKTRSTRVTKINIQDYLENPEARTYDTDRAKMGEIMKAQGWDKPSLSLSPEEFDKIIAEGPGNKGLSLVYRGGPQGLEEGFITGKHWVGDGNAGPGIYVTNNVDRAGSYEALAMKQTGGGELVQILVPSDMIYKAPDRQTWTGNKNPLPAPINGASRADTLEIAADGIKAYSSVLESTAGDFVIYDPSSIIIRRSK